jgi:hypothetical protein
MQLVRSELPTAPLAFLSQAEWWRLGLAVAAAQRFVVVQSSVGPQRHIDTGAHRWLSVHRWLLAATTVHRQPLKDGLKRPETRTRGLKPNNLEQILDHNILLHNMQ